MERKSGPNRAGSFIRRRFVFIAALALAILWAASAVAYGILLRGSSPIVTITNYGRFLRAPTRGNGGGQFAPSGGVELLEQGAFIPLKPGMEIGLTYEIWYPENRKLLLDASLTHLGPDGRVLDGPFRKTSLVYPGTGGYFAGWIFDKTYEEYLGDWVLELRWKGALLHRQRYYFYDAH